VKRAVLWGVVLALCMKESVYAQDAVLSPSTPPPAAYCPISVRLDAIASRENDVAFSLWADDVAAKATGTLVVYAGTRRYRIPFGGAVAADPRNTAILPTPIVVHFDTATTVDSAYVASLDNIDCLIHSPFLRSRTPELVPFTFPLERRTYPDWSKPWKAFLELAGDAPELGAPSAETIEAPNCAKPYARAYTTHPAIPAPNQSPYRGEVVVRVTIAGNGSLLGLRVDKSSHVALADAIAVDATARSQFAPQVYRCAPITGVYLFVVEFSRS
jgi:TonB family protein